MSGKNLLMLVFLVLTGLVVGAVVVTMQSSPTGIGSGGGGPVTKPDEEELRELPPLRDRPAPTIGEVAGRVLDPDGKPVAGATVSLSVHRDFVESSRGFDVRMGGSGMSGTFTAAPPAGHAALGSVTTGEDGSFAFTTIEPGPFTVRADRAGFGSVRESDVERGTRDLVLKLAPACTIRGLVHDELGATVPGVVVTAGLASTLTDEQGGFVLADVGAGAEVRILARANGYESATLDLELGHGDDRTLDEPMVIESKTGLTGRVFDPAGGPLEGATARVTTNLMNMSTATTDEGGRYFFESPGEGRVDLSIRHMEYLTGTLEGIRYREGERVIAPDVRLQPGGVIAGRILGPDGQPVAGARAVAMEESGEFDMSQLMLLGTGMGGDERPGSDSDGRYRVPGLSSGTYLLSVSADGYRPFLQKQINVQVPETSTVEVVLDPGASIAGTVVDGSGKPLAGAKVSAITDDAPRDPENFKEQILIGDWSANVETSEDGSFFMSGLGESKVHLTIEKDGYSKKFVDDIEPGTSDLAVTLEETGSISGRVIDGVSGEPVAGAMVSADDSTSGHTETDEDGSFSLGSVSPGELTVSVESDEHLLEEHAGVTVVSGSPTTGVEIRLRRGESLSGIVVRASNGSPVADASVSADGPVSRFAQTDEQGRFTLKGLAKGVYDLEADAKGFADAALDNVAVPNSGEVRIELLMGGTIRGLVLDENGEPVSGQMVMSGTGPGMFGNGTTTGADGTFVFENVPAGKQTLMVMKLQAGSGQGIGFGANSQSVVVVEGQEVFVTFGGAGAPKKTRLKGRLLDHGRPAGGRMLMFMKGDIEGGMAEIMSSFKMVTTGKDGSFDVADLEAGSYRVFSGNMGGDMGMSMELTVSDEGGVLEQDLTLPDGIFAGTVVRADTGAGVAGAKLLLVDPQLITKPATSFFDILALMKGQFTSGEGGAFSIDTAAKGSMLLQVLAPGLAPAVIEGITIGAQPGQPLRISLAPPTAVEVRVKDSAGEPVIGAPVLIFDGKGRRMMVMEDNLPSTSSDGIATLNLSAGTWRILVQPKGLASAMQEINLPGKTAVDFVLRPGGTLSTVVTSAGGPVAGAVIRTFDASGIEIAHHLTQEGMMMGAPSQKTGEDGRHTREHLPAGTYRVTATTPDGRTGVGSARIADGGTTELAVQLK